MRKIVLVGVAALLVASLVLAACVGGGKRIQAVDVHGHTLEQIAAEDEAYQEARMAEQRKMEAYAEAEKEAERRKLEEYAQRVKAMKENPPEAKENDFVVELTKDGTGAVIKEYVGKMSEILGMPLIAIKIPARIQGMPVKEINRAFNGQHNLEIVVIPDSVTVITSSAFNACGSLRNITLPAGLTTIGDYAFRNTGLTSVTIPAGVKTIGNGAFRNTRLTSVTIPASVTSIGNEAFAQTNLTSVTIPDSVTSIGNEVFRDSGLVNVNISPVKRKMSSSVELWGAVGGGTFGGCPDLSLASQAAIRAAYAAAE